MKDKPDKFYSLAIVDPPYGIGASSKKNYHANSITKYNKKEWDNKIPDKKYFDELFRISNNQIIWGGNYFTKFLPPAKNWIVWNKMQPENVSFSMHELAFYSGKGQAKIFTHYNGGNRVSNNLEKAQQYIRIHPTQKPVALYKWLLQNYAKPGDKLLDTHSGSGSFRIAAYDMGFDLDSCEIDEDYFKDNNARFENHIKQTDLFKPEERQKNIYSQPGLL